MARLVEASAIQFTLKAIFDSPAYSTLAGELSLFKSMSLLSLVVSSYR